MQPSEAALAAAAKQRVKRAMGQLRDATRDLMALNDGQTIVGTVPVAREADVRRADAMIEIGLARHGAIDVVVLARPHHGP